MPEETYVASSSWAGACNTEYARVNDPRWVSRPSLTQPWRTVGSHIRDVITGCAIEILSAFATPRQIFPAETRLRCGSEYNPRYL